MNLDFLDKIRILVVGDVMIDRYLIGVADRISGEAPVPIVRITKEEKRPGGAANVYENLKALGISCELAKVIGPPIVKTRIVAHGQQICRYDEEGKPGEYSLPGMTLFGFDAVIISDYAKGAITQKIVDDFRDCRKYGGLFLAMDPKPKNRLDITGMDLLTPNQDEMNQYAERGYDPKPRHLLVTQGALGMTLNGSLWLPPECAGPVDVTGAGDTVVAVMTAALVGGLSPEDSARLASKAAAVVVQKFGTATCSRAELAACYGT